MEADFQVCRNCKRNVPSLHFTLHEAHCLHFLALCPECEEPILQSKMKDHVEAVHQQGVGVVSSIFPVTKESQQHPAKCKFCELAVHLSNLDIHESHCGSRTEHCPHCNQPITLPALAQHKDVCQSSKGRPEEGKRIVSPGRKIHCDHCKQMIPENQYVSHMNMQKQSLIYLRNGKPIILPSSLAIMETEKQTSTLRKDVRPKTKIGNSSRKQKTKDQSDTADLPLMSVLQQGAALPAGDEDAYDILRRCCQCGILLPLPILNEHQSVTGHPRPSRLTFQNKGQHHPEMFGNQQLWRDVAGIAFTQSTSFASPCWWSGQTTERRSV
ncbi:XIAP-associated factor 1 isoform X2 [Meriones unguiculatus]|uniref:XIAP-associated factor 1 isoform X2 n=1 Tax=Meriones unguiculatus TaxID=10047 RepID=UPI00293E8596|nr:XIAP-associated factor 1 isoform X2 [Meriones unguiculatus]